MDRIRIFPILTFLISCYFLIAKNGFSNTFTYTPLQSHYCWRIFWEWDCAHFFLAATVCFEHRFETVVEKF